MITRKEIEAILSLYEKHGWNLSRVLLCAKLKSSFSNSEIKEIFGTSEITEAKVDAVWFSRPSKHGKTAWELRHLNIKPFAIFELFDEEIDEIKKTQELEKIENRLIEHASHK